ncbi:YraN family protein [Amycolatopsis sp. NPDC051903]|uniref:YraN family protein n=1 Tax=Amycolatopsis sp. NPDC051903 TaxID=3363936 RepID=UPI00378FB39F
MNDGPNPGALWRRAVGRWGEDLAARHLQNAGLVVLSRNWLCREGELDLVLSDGDKVVFCEVKTRTGTGFGTPAESVTDEKIGRIRRAAQRWLQAHRVGWCATRYDVVTILAPAGAHPEVHHIAGAF